MLPGRQVDEIPLDFLPGIADHYIVDAITDEGASDLLRAILRGRPAR